MISLKISVCQEVHIIFDTGYTISNCRSFKSYLCTKKYKFFVINKIIDENKLAFSWQGVSLSDTVY